MTTAATWTAGGPASDDVEEQEEGDDEARADDPGRRASAPDCSATAARDPLVDTAKPWTEPRAEVRGTEPRSSPGWGRRRRPWAANERPRSRRVGERTRGRFPTAATSNGPTSPSGVQGARSASGSRSAACRSVGISSVVRAGPKRSSHRRPRRGPRDRFRDGGQPEEHDEHRDADEQRRGLGRRGARRTARSRRRSGCVGGEAAQLGSWPTMIVIASPFMYRPGPHSRADRRRSRAARAQADLDETDEECEHPGARDRRALHVARHCERDDRGIDQRRHRGVRTEHEDARRPEDRVAQQAPDRRVQAVHGREAGQLRVGHALRDQDRGKDHTGDNIGAKPPSLIGARHRARPSPIARVARSVWSQVTAPTGPASRPVRRSNAASTRPATGQRPTCPAANPRARRRGSARLCTHGRTRPSRPAR